jgi:hypothetical protein
VASDGGIFGFGDAPFYGDVASVGATDVIGIAPTAPMLPPEPLGYRRAALSSAPSSTRHELGARPNVPYSTER